MRRERHPVLQGPRRGRLVRPLRRHCPIAAVNHHGGGLPPRRGRLWGRYRVSWALERTVWSPPASGNTASLGRIIRAGPAGPWARLIRRPCRFFLIGLFLELSPRGRDFHLRFAAPGYCPTEAILLTVFWISLTVAGEQPNQHRRAIFLYRHSALAINARHAKRHFCQARIRRSLFASTRTSVLDMLAKPL